MIYVLVGAACLTGVALLVAAGLLVWRSRKVNAASRARAKHRSIDVGMCRCGHISLSHEHYRQGDDCALCTCRAFRKLRLGARPQTVSETSLEWVAQ